MPTRKYRWSKVYESSEEELVTLLQQKHIVAARWVLDDDGARVPSFTDTGILLWCAEGQFSCLVNGVRYAIQTGDTLEIAAGSTWEAVARFGGCVVYQAASTPA